MSTILDPSKLPADGAGLSAEAAAEFPLFTKGVDLARADYGLFLLNKNLAQVKTALIRSEKVFLSKPLSTNRSDGCAV